jgi:Ataxin-3
VLRAALKNKYGLDLPNIRMEGMRNLEVTEIEGFICNREAHWFAIRKINGRFWNLNSMQERPVIISHFKLAQEIQNLQNSGYSVFCVPAGLPPPCSSKSQRERGLPQYWWKEEDLVQGKGSSAITAATDPWRDVGTGMRLDGGHTTSSPGRIGDLTEEEQIQLALAASMEPTVAAAANDDSIIIDLTPEPPAGKDACRIQFRLPDGSKKVRRFLLNDSVKMLYSFVDQESSGSQGRRLQLMAGFPPKNLEGSKDKTIGEASLAGETVSSKYA